MISLDTSGLAEFDRQVGIAFFELEAELSRRFADFTQKVFKSIVQTSPQWSGNLAANWNYSVNFPDESYTATPQKQQRSKKPYQVGDPAAVSKALSRMSAVQPPSWAQPVYITNATPENDGGYLVEGIVNGKVKLRPVNLVPAQRALFEFSIKQFEGAIL